MPNLLRPDIGKVRKRNFKPPKPKVKELDTPLMDQPFEYPLVHVSTWCVRDILKTLKRDTIYTMFNLINITKKNENLILNRLGLPAQTMPEITSSLGHDTKTEQAAISNLIKNQIIMKQYSSQYNCRCYYINPYVMFYGTSIPDFVYEIFTDTKWRAYHKSFTLSSLEY